MPDSSPSTRTRITSSRRLMINTVLNLMNQVFTVIVNFAVVGFFLDTLGEERYGIWILVGSIFSYRNLMSMGLNSAVNRNIPVPSHGEICHLLLESSALPSPISLHRPTRPPRHDR